MWRCFIFPFWLGEFLHTMVIGYQSSTNSSVPVLIWHSLGTLQLKVVLAFRDPFSNIAIVFTCVHAQMGPVIKTIRAI